MCVQWSMARVDDRSDQLSMSISDVSSEGSPASRSGPKYLLWSSFARKSTQEIKVAITKQAKEAQKNLLRLSLAES